jgi:hypothetical protein
MPSHQRCALLFAVITIVFAFYVLIETTDAAPTNEAEAYVERYWDCVSTESTHNSTLRTLSPDAVVEQVYQLETRLHERMVLLAQECALRASDAFYRFQTGLVQLPLGIKSRERDVSPAPCSCPTPAPAAPCPTLAPCVDRVEQKVFRIMDHCELQSTFHEWCTNLVVPSALTCTRTCRRKNYKLYECACIHPT